MQASITETGPVYITARRQISRRAMRNAIRRALEQLLIMGVLASYIAGILLLANWVMGLP